MDEQYDFRLQKLIGIVIFSMIIVTGVYIGDKYLRKSTVVFCDVGQGDSAYIRTQSGEDIMVDFGPDKSVLNCIGRYMPFYDNEIDLAFISHFDMDHYGGIVNVLSRYKIKQLIYPECADKKCQELLNSLKSKKIPYSSLNLIKTPEFTLIPMEMGDRGSASGKNNDSEVFRLEIGKMSVLFTGDANLSVSSGPSERSDYLIDVLKVPHHGSRYNLNSTFLELAEPRVSVISAGKNNQYGHPHKETISMLKALKQKYLRTDQEGDVVIELLGESFQVKTQKSGDKYSFKYLNR